MVTELFKSLENCPGILTKKSRRFRQDFSPSNLCKLYRVCLPNPGGLGRNAAGVHYRSDGEGLRLGESVAIGILQDYRKTYNEDFSGFSFTKFDGTTIII